MKIGMTREFFTISTSILILYFLLINSFYALLILISIPLIRKRFQEVESENLSKLLKSESLPTIAIIVPAYNIQDLVCTTAVNCLDVYYSAKELIIVNDGSTDNTLDTLKEKFQLVEIPILQPQKIQTAKVRTLYQSRTHPNLYVVDKEQGGRGDALNAGVNFSKSQLFLVIDADTILEKDALLRMIRPFLTYPEIVAQGGTLRIINGCKVKNGKITEINLPKDYLSTVQVGEYLRAFLYGRLGWNKLGGVLIVSGAFGLLKKQAVVECGGYDPKTIGEDFELTMRLTKYQRDRGYRRAIAFIPDPVAWTYVPDNWKWLGRQRTRWHQGLTQVLWKYRSFCLNPKYGMTSLVGYSYMVLGEFIEPIAEVFGYLLVIFGMSLGYMTLRETILFFLVAMGITTLITVISIILEIVTFRRYKRLSQLIIMICYSIFENLGFRQFYLFWRIRGLWYQIIGKSQW